MGLGCGSGEEQLFRSASGSSALGTSISHMSKDRSVDSTEGGGSAAGGGALLAEAAEDLAGAAAAESVQYL
eukprot:scaffold9097_cov108-Isochrysis_galbana.AAC.2